MHEVISFEEYNSIYSTNPGKQQIKESPSPLWHYNFPFNRFQGKSNLIFGKTSWLMPLISFNYSGSLSPAYLKATYLSISYNQSVSYIILFWKFFVKLQARPATRPKGEETDFVLKFKSEDNLHMPTVWKRFCFLNRDKFSNKLDYGPGGNMLQANYYFKAEKGS